MDTKARDLAAVFKRASKDGILEQPFREPVEEHLIALAKAEKIDLQPHKEVIRANSMSQSLEPRDLLRRICQNVVGIDLNPLAVIAARTNYLLALGPLLKLRGNEPLEIPVYLADSVMTPTRGDAESHPGPLPGHAVPPPYRPHTCRVAFKRRH